MRWYSITRHHPFVLPHCTVLIPFHDNNGTPRCGQTLARSGRQRWRFLSWLDMYDMLHSIMLYGTRRCMHVARKRTHDCDCKYDQLAARYHPPTSSSASTGLSVAFVAHCTVCHAPSAHTIRHAPRPQPSPAHSASYFAASLRFPAGAAFAHATSVSTSYE